jgi:hypothetical protein
MIMSNATKLGLVAAMIGVTATACVSSMANVGTDPTPAADAGGTDAAAVIDGADAGKPGLDAAPGSCDAGLATCGGACVSLGNDPKNCGGCGIDCGAHTCAIGICQTDEVLAANQGGPAGLALDGTSVYWAAETDKTVMKMPLAGGNATPLATNQDDPYAIAVDGTTVYWTNVTTNTVMRVPLGGGSPTAVVTDPSVGDSLAIDATSVYFAGANKIMKAPKGGGSAVKVADAPYATNVVVSGSWLYFGSSSPTFQPQVNRVPVTGGTPTALGTSTGSMVVAKSSMAVDGTFVYWADGDYVTKVPLAGGAPQQVVSAFGVWRVAVDANTLYWPAGVAVKKMPIGGGADSNVANCFQGCPLALAVSPTHLYWTTTDRIVRAPK